MHDNYYSTMDNNVNNHVYAGYNNFQTFLNNIFKFWTCMNTMRVINSYTSEIGRIPRFKIQRQKTCGLESLHS
jgi:hypothetical protein